MNDVKNYSLVYAYSAYSHPCLGSPPSKGSFFLASKRNKKRRLKIFLSKVVVWLVQWNPKNFLGRFYRNGETVLWPS